MLKIFLQLELPGGFWKHEQKVFMSKQKACFEIMRH